MNLAELIGVIQTQKIERMVDAHVVSLTTDSRDVKPGTLFVAIKGYTVDGHDYAQQAEAQGAVAIVSERLLDVTIPVILVRSTTRAMAELAGKFYDYPSEKMRMIGITGTNGKTTTTTIVRDVLAQLGRKTGIIGTVEVKIGDRVVPSRNTTPQSSELQAFFHQMQQEGVEDVIMEVSSHGLELGRVTGTDFDVAGFTNLTHDHLDFHKTFENYARAKGLLFAQLGQRLSDQKVAVLNADDETSAMFEMMTGARVLTYGIDQPADLQAKNITQTLQETTFTMVYQEQAIELTVQFIGRFNVYNLLLATGILLSIGYSLTEISNAITQIQPAKGRMQRLPIEGYNIYVDYAHTPDGIEQCLKALVDVPKENIIFLIGTGGNRDVTKRPMMGQLASTYAGTVVITTDDPRFESYESITSGIASGMLHDQFVEIGDREEAVRYAASLARPDNIVILAGKGHEKYQIIGDEKTPLDEEQLVKEMIRQLEEKK
ncbi:UDP-N-acetylmuramoyl-L-alanyl-D-glutamate--2,6-diaminopimelate ligase [Exiguobacterium sp. RIT452]|uniref:UDP-N-acetylmuramyl-tripeptide synthetase n=1 Tax=Exiguobacterium undae TaxID=169177 RepID=A0ABX2VA76_9BACL|nr:MULTISPECIES: UDP-N-acetylmuramoyl-L-alanyl-D-glutamate--2,6-diaminopimelate ligase [Exiguobacterium]OAN15125.1 UDP-N-acetylmuramoyl-L-alanyl-D-glutamate--2,6-diaminopimelate ligase [Exiguobacterium undae]RJP00386.1 UDP-N-acetylmuramoyl-L-alanyl-D-glutamate--2,6-diaminopimelate ligase [Exiguobacterium sp. RIT452]